jgi:hypothetical protein
MKACRTQLVLLRSTGRGRYLAALSSNGTTILLKLDQISSYDRCLSLRTAKSDRLLAACVLHWRDNGAGPAPGVHRKNVARSSLLAQRLSFRIQCLPEVPARGWHWCSDADRTHRQRPGATSDNGFRGTARQQRQGKLKAPPSGRTPAGPKVCPCAERPAVPRQPAQRPYACCTRRTESRTRYCL